MNDLETPNLYIGKIIGNNYLQGEVIFFDENNIIMKILIVEDTYFQRYVDKDQTYSLFRHQNWNGNLLLWEMDPAFMKRRVSQLLLQWEKNIGWSWDLDS